MEVDNLLTIEELMALLKISRAKVYRMIDSGTMPYVRVGGQFRFIEREVLKALKDATKSFQVARLR